MSHEKHMALVLRLAEEAFARGDWPVAAAIVREDAVIATGQNRQVSRADATCHAETDAIQTARKAGVDLRGATAYTTTEPCPMCAWALRLSGISKVVMGFRHADVGRADLGSYSLEKFASLLGYEVSVVSGVMKEECLAISHRWNGGSK